MFLYHGSKVLVDTLVRKQPNSSQLHRINESLNAIYATPSFRFALAMAVRPSGRSTVDNTRKTIHFENPDAFDPEQEVYIYTIDPRPIPKEKIIRVDEWQLAIVVNMIEPVNIERRKAGDVADYYTIV